MEFSKAKIASTALSAMWSLEDWVNKHKYQSKMKKDCDAIENIQRVYRLKERGMITEEEYDSVKGKLIKLI